MLPETEYKSLLDNIGQTYKAARARAYAALNQEFPEANILEFLGIPENIQLSKRNWKRS
jgi:hypothetical protein